MIEAGVLNADERFELIEGELYPMSPKNSPHVVIEARLFRLLARELPETIELAAASTLYLSQSTFLEPDILVYPRTDDPTALKGDEVLLAIEVSDTSLKRDMEAKAPLYAAHGVQDLWIIDVNGQKTHVHSDPGLLGYKEIRSTALDETLNLPFDSGFEIRISDLLTQS